MKKWLRGVLLPRRRFSTRAEPSRNPDLGSTATLAPEAFQRLPGKLGRGAQVCFCLLPRKICSLQKITSDHVCFRFLDKRSSEDSWGTVETRGRYSLQSPRALQISSCCFQGLSHWILRHFRYVTHFVYVTFGSAQQKDCNSRITHRFIPRNGPSWNAFRPENNPTKVSAEVMFQVFTNFLMFPRLSWFEWSDFCDSCPVCFERVTSMNCVIFSQ